MLAFLGGGLLQFGAGPKCSFPFAQLPFVFVGRKLVRQMDFFHNSWHYTTYTYILE